MDKINDNIVDISYQQTGKSSNTNELGMREMQAKAYEARNHRFLLINPHCSYPLCNSLISNIRIF